MLNVWSCMVRSGSRFWGTSTKPANPEWVHVDPEISPFGFDALFVNGIRLFQVDCEIRH